MSNKKTFSFESADHKKRYDEAINQNIEELKRRLGISNVDLRSLSLTEADKELLNTFCANTFRNIAYYDKKIQEEAANRRKYGTWTVVCLILIPVVIFIVTDLDMFQNLRGLGAVSGWTVAILGSFLGVHKFVSQWIDAQKFRSNFHQAKVDLMNNLYQLIEDYAGTAIAEGFEAADDSVFTETFVQALKSGVKESRKIVNEESKKYFEMVSSPSFDLSSALTSSAGTAQSLFQSYKSRRFNLEQLEQEAAEDRQEHRNSQKELNVTNAKIYSKEMRLERMEIERRKIAQVLERVTDENKIEQYRAEFDAVDDEIEKILMEMYILEQERNYNKFIVDRYSEDD